MKSAVVIFPGSNRVDDVCYALEKVTKYKPTRLWHKDTEIDNNLDLIVLPGGFSYGDYLRSGAIAAHSPIMKEIIKTADNGTLILGICNGFQILTEAQLLPGALIRNNHLRFTCKFVNLIIENNKTSFSNQYQDKQIINCPVAHHDGNYFASPAKIKELEESNQIVFRYTNDSNPNGSMNNIAGIMNRQGNVLGLMPHPENYIEEEQGGCDGKGLFQSLLNTIEQR